MEAAGGHGRLRHRGLQPAVGAKGVDWCRGVGVETLEVNNGGIRFRWNIYMITGWWFGCHEFGIFPLILGFDDHPN